MDAPQGGLEASTASIHGDKLLQVRGSNQHPPIHCRAKAKPRPSCSLLYPTAPEKPLGMEVREPPWAAHPRAASQPFPLVFTKGGREGNLSDRA